MCACGCGLQRSPFNSLLMIQCAKIPAEPDTEHDSRFQSVGLSGPPRDCKMQLEIKELEIGHRLRQPIITSPFDNCLYLCQLTADQLSVDATFTLVWHTMKAPGSRGRGGCWVRLG